MTPLRADLLERVGQARTQLMLPTPDSKLIAKNAREIAESIKGSSPAMDNIIAASRILTGGVPAPIVNPKEALAKAQKSADEEIAATKRVKPAKPGFLADRRLKEKYAEVEVAYKAIVDAFLTGKPDDVITGAVADYTARVDAYTGEPAAIAATAAAATAKKGEVAIDAVTEKEALSGFTIPSRPWISAEWKKAYSTLVEGPEKAAVISAYKATKEPSANAAATDAFAAARTAYQAKLNEYATFGQSKAADVKLQKEAESAAKAARVSEMMSRPLYTEARAAYDEVAALREAMFTAYVNAKKSGVSTPFSDDAVTQAAKDKYEDKLTGLRNRLAYASAANRLRNIPLETRKGITAAATAKKDEAEALAISASYIEPPPSTADVPFESFRNYLQQVYDKLLIERVAATNMAKKQSYAMRMKAYTADLAKLKKKDVTVKDYKKTLINRFFAWVGNGNQRDRHPTTPLYRVRTEYITTQLEGQNEIKLKALIDATTVADGDIKIAMDKIRTEITNETVTNLSTLNPQFELVVGGMGWAELENTDLADRQNAEATAFMEEKLANARTAIRTGNIGNISTRIGEMYNLEAMGSGRAGEQLGIYTTTPNFNSNVPRRNAIEAAFISRSPENARRLAVEARQARRAEAAAAAAAAEAAANVARREAAAAAEAAAAEAAAANVARREAAAAAEAAANIARREAAANVARREAAAAAEAAANVARREAAANVARREAARKAAVNAALVTARTTGPIDANTEPVKAAYAALLANTSVPPKKELIKDYALTKLVAARKALEAAENAAGMAAVRQTRNSKTGALASAQERARTTGKRRGPALKELPGLRTEVKAAQAAYNAAYAGQAAVLQPFKNARNAALRVYKPLRGGRRKTRKGRGQRRRATRRG